MEGTPGVAEKVTLRCRGCLAKRSSWVGVLLGGAAAAVIAMHGRSIAASRADPLDLTELSLEELVSLEVTSVSKKAERRSAAAAALYVITPEDVQRSGVTTLADALRMAPGTHVARIDANKWAVSIRGFGGRFSNKLLVLMDGRTLYTPLFGGTFWDAQDTLLEDVERIEVVRGPGGTLWGANAMNGVINVITKSARDTHGAFLSTGGGTEERAFGAARYGGSIGDDFHYRVYGSYVERDEGFAAAGDPGDDWRLGRLGFRTDWDVTSDDLVTLQGDVYDGEAGQPGSDEMPRSLGDDDLTGAYALGRWTRRLGESSDAALQIYYDHTDRNDPFFRERRGTFDIDAQHRFPLPGNQEIV